MTAHPGKVVPVRVARVARVATGDHPHSDQSEAEAGLKIPTHYREKTSEHALCLNCPLGFLDLISTSTRNTYGSLP